MATLKELIELSGVQQIAPGRTVGEQVYDDQVESGQIQYGDVAPSDYGYTGLIEKGSEFNTPYTMRSRPGLLSVYDRLTGPLKNVFEQYGPQIAGSIMGGIMGIPGVGFLMNRLPNDPYSQNRMDMYGAYRGADGFMKDKFGYNLGTTLFKNKFMEPGSSSFRSYALEGLGSLNPVAADQYYQENYGLNFNQVKDAIQNKEDPFGSAGIIDMGADYQGGGNNENNNFNDSSGRGGGSFGDATNDASFSDYS